jgi:hypothetical protein
MHLVGTLLHFRQRLALLMPQPYLAARNVLPVQQT